MFSKGDPHQIETYLNCICHTFMVIVDTGSILYFLCYRVASSEAVNYRTLSLKDLAKSVMAEGGWSDLLVLCVPKLYRFLAFLIFFSGFSL